MRTTSYAVTITGSHQLVVNDLPVDAPAGIAAGDSESLLAWAFDRVSDAHVENGGVMTLTVRDHRDGGYGTFEHVLKPNEDITIEDVRRRVGKDASTLHSGGGALARSAEVGEPSTPDSDPESLISSEALASTAEEGEEPASSGGNEVIETSATEEAPSVAVEPMPSPSVEAEAPAQSESERTPAVAAPLVGSTAATEGAAPSGDTGGEVEIGPLPFQPLPDANDDEEAEEKVEAPPAFQPTEAEQVAEEEAEQARRLAHESEQEAAEIERLRREAEAREAEQQAVQEQAERERTEVNAEIEAVAVKHKGKGFLKRGPKVTKPRKEPRVRKGKEERPERPAKVSRRDAAKNEQRDKIISENKTAADKVADTRGWRRVSRVIPRPVVGEEVIRKRKSRPWLIPLLLIPLLLVFGYKYYMDNQSEIHTAICVDERSMMRQSTDAACKDPESPTYNRWFYVPRDSTVPAINSRVDPAQGSLQPPDKDATVTYGFADDGGVVGE